MNLVNLSAFQSNISTQNGKSRETWNTVHSCPVTQSCPTLCDLMDYIPCQAPLSMGFSTRILEWVAISSSTGPSQPRDQNPTSCVGRLFFTIEPPEKNLEHSTSTYILNFKEKSR